MTLAIRMSDRVKETSTTTGTGNLTLAGAVSQFEAFETNFPNADADRFYYAIAGQTGTEWEVGIGYLSGSTTLVRETVLNSSNSDALVSLSAGTKNVFATIPADLISDAPTWGEMVAAISGAALP